MSFGVVIIPIQEAQLITVIILAAKRLMIVDVQTGGQEL